MWAEVRVAVSQQWIRKSSVKLRLVAGEAVTEAAVLSKTKTVMRTKINIQILEEAGVKVLAAVSQPWMKKSGAKSQRVGDEPVVVVEVHMKMKTAMKRRMKINTTLGPEMNGVLVAVLPPWIQKNNAKSQRVEGEPAMVVEVHMKMKTAMKMKTKGNTRVPEVLDEEVLGVVSRPWMKRSSARLPVVVDEPLIKKGLLMNSHHEKPARRAA
jgi:predicted RNA-binding protein